MKIKRESFKPLKHSRADVKHFTEDSSEQKLVVRSLLGPSFKRRRLVVRNEAVPLICKPAIGQKTCNVKLSK